MKRSYIVQRVRRELGDDQYDETIITDAANDFVFELFNDTRTRLMEESDTVSAKAGATVADYPSDLQTIIGIYVTAPRVFRLSAPLEYATFMQNYANFATSTARQADAWTPYGNRMRFAAPLNADHTFQIDYLRVPEKMVKDGDDCEVPDNYVELVIKGTKLRVMEVDEDYDVAQNERDTLAGLVTTFKRNEGRGGGKVGPVSVMRTNRRAGRTGDPTVDGLRG